MGHQTSIFKTVFAVFLLGILGVVATGCGKKTTTQAKAQEIKIWRFDQDIEPFRDLIANFPKDRAGDFPNLKISYEQKRLEGYEFAALKSQAGRLGPDIWSIPNDWIGDYHDQVLTLGDGFFKAPGDKSTKTTAQRVSEIYPKGIAEQIISTDGTKVYGLPLNADSLQLYINFDIFGSALDEFRKSQGPNASDDTIQPVRQLLNRAPATWSDVVDQIKYLTIRDGNTIKRSGIALGTADNVPESDDILQLLMYQNGAKIISDDRKSVLFQVPTTTPSGGSVRPGEKALDFYYSFADPTKSTYSWSASMPQALDAFTQGKVAMVLAYSDFGKKIAVKKPGFSYTVSPAPQISTSQVAVNYIKFDIETVTKTGTNPNAAAEILKQYANKSSATGLARLQKVESPFLETLKENNEFTSKQILTGKSTFKVNHTQFDSIFRQMMVDVSQNNISVADAIKNGSDQLDILLNPTLAAPN